MEWKESSEQGENRVQISIEGGIARVQLQRPERRNALDFAMFKAIERVQRRLKRDRSVRVVILSGDGPDFCSGLDVGSVMGQKWQALQLLWKWWPGTANLAQKVSTGWRDLPVPVIAAIQGRCWGGGLQIVLGADFRVAEPDADFSIMEGRWGLIPDMGGNLALRELMNQDQALWLAMTAERIDGARAESLGLVTSLDEDPQKRAGEMAEQLLERSPDALAAVKRLVRGRSVSGRGRVLAAESWSQWRMLLGRNQRIAVARQRGRESFYQPRQRW